MRSGTILVVDNDEDTREGLCRLLSREGYAVDVAADGVEALECVQRHPYELVITDMLMPRLGGLVLLQRLKETRPNIPVMLLTAFGDWASYAQAIKLGASAYLTKPYRSEELLQHVQRVLSKAGDEAVGSAPTRS